jgi:hypothetical protein
MPRILAQTDDHRTVLGEPGVQVSAVSDKHSAVSTLDRLEVAICNAESVRVRGNARTRRRPATLPTGDQREAY